MEYFYDDKRHLVCHPYSIESLHAMADDLGIKRCHYHIHPYPHYDIPKTRFNEILSKCTRVVRKEIIYIIHGQDEERKNLRRESSEAWKAYNVLKDLHVLTIDQQNTLSSQLTILYPDGKNNRDKSKS